MYMGNIFCRCERVCIYINWYKYNSHDWIFIVVT